MQIFISYRRSDTQHFAGRIADRLRGYKNIREVFIDVDGIEPGDDFNIKIKDAIRNSTACLLIIGPKWQGPGKGAARIFNDEDFVRQETRTALNNCSLVIPILVENTLMPQAMDLPEDLHKLPKLNAISIRHQQFETDIKRLHDVLTGTLSIAGRPPPGIYAHLFGLLFQTLLGISLAGAVLIGIAIIHYLSTGGQSFNQSFGGNDWVFAMIFGIVGLGATAPIFVHWLRNRQRKGNIEDSSNPEI